MEPFKTFSSIAVPIDIPNCDTDQIIPARFLRRGNNDPEYPRFLFHDLRFNHDGSEKNFVYNQFPYCGGRIIVADINWGCGSSRENAVTALDANDIRSVIAPSIADIHYNNCIKNGVLPIRLAEEVCTKLRQQLREYPGSEVAIDLYAQIVTGPDEITYSFEIDSFDKHRLLSGLDDVSITLEFEGTIEAFRANYHRRHSWAAWG
ncbi:MAG: 3-isopropylmalate dehydratase small subunit [Rhodospirillaceae bacterium TMED8]|nr:3-isopropylmalate dehydratase small subunit [Magnetovibrio sp.]OUT51413.1 MAG: 3-isopropylmalate dehydratase small subunit [Rhodospirillaceae bacterium TMED8]|tara:strand:+ start:204 stop:818 length:615 start_codon:yes stop_codon:yes gene_type:complete